jgi:hypothetical protein
MVTAESLQEGLTAATPGSRRFSVVRVLRLAAIFAFRALITGHEDSVCITDISWTIKYYLV